MIGELLIKSALLVLTAFGLWGGDMSWADLGEYTPPAEIIYVETSAQQQGNELVFGNLVMELPEGVTAEVKASSDTDDGKIIKLNGAQELDSKAPFPPLMRIAHYTVRYEYKEALVSALLDFIPNVWLECRYDGDREYVFSLNRWETDYKSIYVVVRDEDLYLVEELDLEDDYAFYSLWKQGKVRWQDSGKTVGESERSDRYFKLTYEERVSVICQYSSRKAVFYRDGYYDSDSYIFMLCDADIGRYIYDDDLADINFDGYTDIYVGGRHTLVWNPIQRCYVDVECPDEQFYDGLEPKEYYDGESQDMREKTLQIIPQGLLDEIADAMLSGAETQIFKAMRNEAELTDEELYMLAEENEDIRIRVLEVCRYHGSSYAMAAADIDNDGVKDIAANIYWGGTSGMGEYIFFQGQADGTYKETDSFNAVKEHFDIIAYEGKNYLVRTVVDYTKKINSGFCVIAFEDGLCAEEVYLNLYAEGFDLSVGSVKERYQGYADEVMKDAVSYDEAVYAHGGIVGSAEELAEDNNEYKYKCDLDNDGYAECYNKHIWGTTVMYHPDTLEFEGEDDEGIGLIDEAIYERKRRDEYYNAIMLWADDVDGETVVNVMYQTGLEDFVIVGYVVSGSECREVYEILAAAVYGVEQRRGTGGNR